MKWFIADGIEDRLERVVRVLCPIVGNLIRSNSSSYLDEHALRRELVACILGSRVRFETASAALERLEAEGLLEERWWKYAEDRFEALVLSVLSGQANRGSDRWRYRFPKTRARQIANARDAIAKEPLCERLADSASPRLLRQHLTRDIAGLGPKQASMFIRNCAKSYDLAILDVHVLHYMKIQNLIKSQRTNLGTLAAYEHTETIAVDYANRLGYPVGYLDWAIWATMRAAGELRL